MGCAPRNTPSLDLYSFSSICPWANRWARICSAPLSILIPRCAVTGPRFVKLRTNHTTAMMTNAHSATMNNTQSSQPPQPRPS
jgi:hypothetical protein